MNGIHDMGGMHGWGPVRPEQDEPPFHAPWEGRVLGLTLAMGATGEWNIDMSRSARESLPTATYVASSYYRIWLLGLEKLLLERGLVSEQELALGHALGPGRPVARVLKSEAVQDTLARGAPTTRPVATAARFAVGDRVRTLNEHPAGHTRLPRYVRGHVGRVSRVHGCHVFADRHAVQGTDGRFDEAPQWLYGVCFEGRELWGSQAEPGLQVSVDAWQSYLEPA